MTDEPQIIYHTEQEPVLYVGIYPVSLPADKSDPTDILPAFTGWEWRVIKGRKNHVGTRSTILKSLLEVDTHLRNWMKRTGCDHAVCVRHPRPAEDF